MRYRRVKGSWNHEEPLLDWLAKQIQDDEDGSIYAPDTKRIKEVNDACQKLHDTLLEMNPDAKITVKQGTMSKSAICFSVNDISLEVDDAKKFAEGIAIASNFEIMPKTNGTVDLDVTFYGCYKRIGKIEDETGEF